VSGRRFLFGFAAAILGLVALWAGVLATLDALGRLKPPAFTNRWEFDATLAMLRAQPPERIDLLAVGSSTTFYGIDGPLLEHELGDIRVFNAAALGLKLHQTAWLIGFFRELHPEIAMVVTVSTLIDFESCPPGSAAIFDPGHVRSFLAGRWPWLVWHFRQFDPLGVLRAARDLPERRALGWDRLDSMRLGPRGGQLLDVPREQLPARVVRGVLGGFDPRCYEALDRLAATLAADGVRFLFVLAPMRPGYLAEWDPDGSQLAAHRTRLRAILTFHGAAFLDAHGELALPEEAFFDAYHLRAPFARQQTRLIATALRQVPQPEGRHVAGNRLGEATVISDSLHLGLRRDR
jgi:hypothetical protein